MEGDDEGCCFPQCFDRAFRTLQFMARDRGYTILEKAACEGCTVESPGEFRAFVARGHRNDEAARLLILLLAGKKCDTKMATAAVQMAETMASSELLVVYNSLSEDMTPTASRLLLQPNAGHHDMARHVFSRGQLTVPYVYHNDVPVHRVFRGTRAKELLKKHRTQAAHLGEMSYLDPVACWYNFQPGDIVMVSRGKLGTVGPTQRIDRIVAAVPKFGNRKNT